MNITETKQYALHRVEVSNTGSGFQHRVCCGHAEGDWQSFTGIASLGNFRHATDYFVGSLPVGVLFRVTPQEELS